jgi:hypothetical protein
VGGVGAWSVEGEEDSTSPFIISFSRLLFMEGKNISVQE